MFILRITDNILNTYIYLELSDSSSLVSSSHDSCTADSSNVDSEPASSAPVSTPYIDSSLEKGRGVDL